MIDIETYDWRQNVFGKEGMQCHKKKDFGDKFENLYGIYGYIFKKESKEFRGA